jgi:hypothetical protein
LNNFPEALAQVAEGQEPKDKRTALPSPGKLNVKGVGL